MDKIYVIDSDGDSRVALESLFKNMGLENIRVLPPTAETEAGAVYVLMGQREESLKPEKAFPRPVRAGAVLEWLRTRRAAATISEEIIRFGEYVLNTLNHELVLAGGNVIRLTEKEGHLLALLVQAGGQAVSRREILEKIWAHGEGVESHTLETHVHRLRQKIENDPARPVLILTDDAGYRLRAP